MRHSTNSCKNIRRKYYLCDTNLACVFASIPPARSRSRYLPIFAITVIFSEKVANSCRAQLNKLCCENEHDSAQQKTEDDRKVGVSVEGREKRTTAKVYSIYIAQEVMKKKASGEQRYKRNSAHRLFTGYA